MFLYDYIFNVKYELEGIKELKDIKKNEFLVELLGNYNTVYTAYKNKKPIRKINKYIFSDDIKISEMLEKYRNVEFEDEAWMRLEGFDNEYYISNYGRVKIQYKSKEKLLSCYQDCKCLIKSNGEMLYSTKVQKKNNKTIANKTLVKLKKDGKFKEYLITRLVGEYFLDLEGKSIDEVVFLHENGLFYDNRASNLIVSTRKGLGLTTGTYSRAIPIEKIDIETNEVLDYYYSVREAARKNFISYQTILDHLDGKTKSAAGINFRVAS